MSEAPYDPLTVLDPEGVDKTDLAFEMLLDAQEPEDLVMRYQMCDSFVRAFDEQRKRQNKKLMELTKTWERRKRAIKSRILEILQERGMHDPKDRDKRKLVTVLGTTYRIKRKDFTCKVKHDDDARSLMIAYLAKEHDAELPQLVESGLIEMRPVPTPQGQKVATETILEYVENTIVASGQSYTDEDEWEFGWCTVRAPGWNLGTRLRPETTPGSIIDAASRLMLRGARELPPSCSMHPAAEYVKADELGHLFSCGCRVIPSDTEAIDELESADE